MATLTLDTYEFVEALKHSGIPEQQAKAIADGFKKVNLENVATKQDLANLKADLFKWLVPLLIGQVAVFATLVKLLTA